MKGQNFLNLDIGLPTEQLRAGIRACLAGEPQPGESTVPATNRRGKAITCKVIASPLLSAAKEIHGCILLMEESTEVPVI